MAGGDRRPHIVLVVADSVRATNLSCYGYERETTPCLDALAQEGVTFKQAISVGSWTLPVHASMFTGLYPSSHGLVRSKDALPPGYPTLAERLRRVGYQTVCFSNNAYISTITGLDQGFEVVEALWKEAKPRGVRRSWRSRLIRELRQRFGPRAEPLIRGLRAVWRLGKRRPRDDKGAARTNQRIQAWLEDGRDERRPFFLFVNYMDCHEPYSPPPPFDRRFLPAKASTRGFPLTDKENILTAPDPVRQEMLEMLRALYDGGVAYLDQRIGELVDLFRRHDLLDNTVFVILSDHGDSLGEHNLIGHRVALYEELVHVPLIIRYPPVFEPGTQVADLVQVIDLYITLLMLAEVDETMPHEASLYTLHPLHRAPRPFAVAENVTPMRWGNELYRMVRTERYKYIWKAGGAHELYDLVHDPAEQHNIIDAAPEALSQLKRMLDGWEMAVAEYTLTGREEAQYEGSVVEHLRALGYEE